MRPLLLLVFATVLAVAAVACSAELSPMADPTTAVAPVSTPTTSVVQATTTSIAPSTSDSLADLIEPLESAIYDPTRLFEDVVAPVALRIDSIGVNSEVLPVGVEENGEMEIPGATDVGWYRHGPSPGGLGSAVLAGHIAYNGRNGVFLKLDRMSVGDIFEVLYEDGSVNSFVVTEVAHYGKTELPFERVFAKDGAPELVLITCGGAFNESLRSYEDNFVVYAAPTT